MSPPQVSLPHLHSPLALLLTFAVAGIANAQPATPDLVDNPAQDTERSDERAAPVFEDGQAQIVAAFSDSENWIQHDLWVETSFDSDGDGRNDRVHVGVTRPPATESQGLRLPVIYMSSPYFGGAPPLTQEHFWDFRHELGATPNPRPEIPEVERREQRPVPSNRLLETWVPRGFIVVHSSSPGTGLSQGCPTIGGINESLAPKAVIDWLNGRAPGFTSVDGEERVYATWTTGKVGMIGTSHPGTLALAAATTGVDGLEVIIPVAPNTSPYHYYRSNGLVRHPGGYLGEDIDVLYDYVHSANDARRAYCNETVRDTEMAEGMDRLTGDLNDFWARRDYLKDVGGIEAAVLMSHAFNDWNVMPEHSVRVYEALKERGVPTKVYFHQGGHGGSPPLAMLNRWFTHYLHGIDNGVEDDANAWITRETDEREQPTPYDDYPNPGAREVTLYPVGGAPGRGELRLARPPVQQQETLVDNASFSGSALAQAEWTEHRLAYLSPTLSKPVHISGTPRVSLRLASSKPAANLSVWLVSLPWNESPEAKITDNIITRGWADPQNRNSLRVSEPLVPGDYYEVSFDLQPDDQIIPAGQQIGLMIFSSDRDFTLRPMPGTQLTIDLSMTSITLPVVGGESALNQALQPAQQRND